VTYATDRIHEEIAYIAYHFHWSLEDILDLEHRDRRRYSEQIATLVTRAVTEG
jgi:transcriptional antiterminator